MKRDLAALAQQPADEALLMRARGVCAARVDLADELHDENRELLELLQREAPEFLASHCWVEGWLASNDEFFSALASNVPITEGRFLGQAQRRPTEFPRPWPGKH